MGLRLGGPILKDKMFFFFNVELGDNISPTTYVIDDSGASDDFGGAAITTADADRFRGILKNKYGYDPGGFGRGYRENGLDDKNFFGRIDYNISNRHRLTLRHNYVSGWRDQNPSKASSTVFAFADVYYKLTNTTNSTVLQLNSTISPNIFNELTLNYTTIRDNRDIPDTLFPQVNVLVAGGYRMTAGSEQYSGANSLNQDIVEITDNLTWYTGKHTFTIGTHNEFFKFANLYIRNFYGYWEFNSLDDFENGKAARYYHDFYTQDPNERWFARFSVAQLGAYVGDKWAILPNLNLTLGLRVDVPIINNIPAANPLVEQTFGIRTDQAASGNLLWSPRVGFNWDVFRDKRTQVRGGVGIFSGRTPYVWISNQYSNTGMEFTRYDLRNPTFSFVPDALNQPKTGPGLVSGVSEVDLIDDKFKYPQLLRTNLAVDQELPWGIVGTLEFIYSKTVNEINYQNLNLRQTGTGVGGRWLYARDVSRSFNDVIYLKNTNKGYQLSFSVQLQKTFNQDSWVNLTYAYGQAKDINSGTSSQASSNFQYNHIRFDANDPELAWSNYDVRHRISAAVSYTFRFFKTAPTTFGLFYAGRSGRPYSHVYNSDANSDTLQENDLVYVPSSIDDVILTNSAGVALSGDALQTAWNSLNTFIEGDPALVAARGKIIMRNASRTPWDQSLDARIAQDLPVPFLTNNRLQITLDFVNVLNLLDKDWGKSQFVSNGRLRPWSFRGYDTATGKEKIQLTLPTTRFSLSNLGSRWGAQIGLRYKFN
ncbi:MAG: TonB-dependent receptor [Candidatus Aminicenantes bacterium]|nr:TonB-dependent receptor [Candidatus Aminicenantes bacterium]